MEILREFKENGYFTSKLYHLLNKKKIVGTSEEIIPSVYASEMRMTCAERLKSLNNVEIDNIITTGGQKADKPVLEFSPRILIFQNYKSHQKIVAKFSVINIGNTSTYLNMVMKESLCFSIKPLNTEMVTRLAPGIKMTFLITFIPRNEYEDYTHRVIFYTDIDQYVVPLIAMGPRPLCDFPDEIIIPDTPLKMENSVQLLIKNIGIVPASFQLNTRCPFAVHPKSLHLQPEQKLDVKVSLKTMYFGQTHGILLAKFETGEVFRIDVKGRANIVSIELEKATVRFLDVYNTMARQQTYKITNKSEHILTYACLKNESVYHDFQEKINLATKLYDVKETESRKYTKLVRYDVVSSREHERVYTRIFYDEIQELVVDESLHFNNLHFSITPIKGYLWPNQTTELTVTFAPKEIGDFQSLVYLDIDGITERVPVKLTGTSLPPCIQLNCETIDMDCIYINKNYHYEIVAMNKGHINGVIEFKDRPTLFGSRISCTPTMLCLPPGEKQIFILNFCNSNQGPYFEEVNFIIRDTSVMLKLYLKGQVVYPSLMFSEPCLDFGKVSVGVPKTLTLDLINESVSSVRGQLKISSDGPEISAMTLEDVDACCADSDVKMPSPPWPREFKIEPEQVEIETDSRIRIEVTLTANKVRSNQTQLELELEKSDSPPIVLPVIYDAKVPEIMTAPPIYLKACFMDFSYHKEIVLATKDYRGFYTLQEEESNTLHVKLSVSRGIIEPNSTIVLPITISTETTGLQEYALRMSLFGLPKPIEVCHIHACGVTPIVTCMPISLHWGELNLLTPSKRTLTLTNDSPVRVNFKTSMFNKDERWSIIPAEGFILPESDSEVVVSVYLLDAANCSNKALIQIEKGKNIIVPVSAVGVGSSIVVGELRDKILLGRHFTNIPLNSTVTIKNCGTKMHTLEWTNTYKSGKGRKNKDPAPTVIKFGLNVFRLLTGEAIDMSITGMSTNACTVSEIWYLVGNVEGANRKELLLECLITAEFVDPKIELSTTQIQLQYDNGPYNEFYKLTDVLTLKNVSKLPLDIEINIKSPFAIIEKRGTYKIPLEDADLCGCITYNESDFNVEKMYKEVGYKKSRELIDCLTLKRIDPLHEGSLMFFQDIHKIKTAFNLTHSIEERLEDQDIMKIQILMDTTKHSSLKSKIYTDVMKIKFTGLKNKDCVKLVGILNFPNISITTPKVDFQCISNHSTACKTLKIHNPTPLLDCFTFKWKSYNIDTLTMPDSPIMDFDIQSKTIQDSASPRTCWIPACPSPSVDLGENSPELSLDFKSKNLLRTENVEIDKETMITKILQKVTPMLPVESDTEFPWAYKFCKKDKYKKCDINDLFQICPHRGLLHPNGILYVNVMFQPTRNVNVHAMLECEVVGGPSEYVLITGQSSDLMYTLNTQKLNFKIRSFHEPATETILLTNIAYLPFKYVTYLNEPKFENEIEATIRNVDPPALLLEPKQKAEINVNMRTGVLGFFRRVFLLEVGYLPHLPIEVEGWGVIPQIYLCCPRPEISKLNAEIGYKAIADLTMLYLEAVNDIFHRDMRSTVYLNSPQQENFLDDPLFQTGWYLCSSRDVYPSVMDIELAIERLLAVSHIKQRPDIIAGYSNNTRTGSIPNFINFTAIIDFGVVITGSKITYIMDIINYGPIANKLQLLKNPYYPWLVIKMCGRLLPGETGKMEILFQPVSEYFKELEQDMETRMNIEVPYGLLMPLTIKALVAVPYLKTNLNKVNLGTVRCGDKILCSIPLKNVGKPVCIWYVTLKLKSTGLCPVTILENSGKYEAGEGGWFTLSFKPTMQMLYEGMLIFRFHMNPTRMSIPIVAKSILPQVHVIGPNIVFPPTLPWSNRTEMYFALTNPCPFPIELIMAHDDMKWQEEEESLLLLSRYYNKPDEMLVPIIQPGSTLPPEIPAFYRLFQDTVKREKELEFAMLTAKPPTPQAAKKASAKSPKPDSKSAKDKSNIKDTVTVKRPRTETEIIADCINDLKNKGVDPLKQCLERVESENDNSSPFSIEKGVIVLVHGSPSSEMACVELANSVAKNLVLPPVNMDSCIIEALCVCSGPAQAALVRAINDQCRYLRKLLSPNQGNTEQEIEEEEEEDPFDDEIDKMQRKLEFLAANKMGAEQSPAKGKGDKKQAPGNKKQGPQPSSTTNSDRSSTDIVMPYSSPCMFAMEYIEDLLTEFFNLDKFSYGFVVETLTSYIINKPTLVLTTMLQSKPSIRTIHLVLCKGDYNKWLQAYEEAHRSVDALEYHQEKEYSEEEIIQIISSFEEMDYEEYENADPEEKAVYIKYGLEHRRQKQAKKSGYRSKRVADKEKKEKKDTPGNSPVSQEGDSKKKMLPKGKAIVNAEVQMMSDRYMEYGKTFETLVSIANNWITEECELGIPMYGLPGQMAAGAAKKGAKKMEAQSLGNLQAPENGIPENRGFPLTIIRCPCNRYGMALVNMFKNSAPIQKALQKDIKLDLLTCPMGKKEFTVLLPKIMPTINHAEPLTWLYLAENPIKKCECNEITDLNLIDDSTQDNILNIISKWQCSCGMSLKNTSSKTSISHMALSSMERPSILQDDGVGDGSPKDYPLPPQCVSTISETSGRIVLQPGDLLRCKYTFNPQIEGFYSVKRFVEVFGWPDSKVEINVSAICDTPRLDSRPKKIFEHFVRRRVEEEVYKKTYLDDLKLFEFGPLFIGLNRIYEEMDTITLRNCSLLPTEVTIEFEEWTQVFNLDQQYIRLEPGLRGKITVSAAPAMVGVHTGQLLLCVKDNPEIIRLTVACTGVTPEIEIMPMNKHIDYGKVLLYRREDDRFIIKNDSVLPVMWKIRNSFDFVKNFIISHTSGIVQSYENQVIPITYIACDVCVLSELELVIDIYDELGRGEPMVVDALYLSAECYDVTVECAYEDPTQSYLDFGNVKVNSVLSKDLYLLNRGKYNVYYRLKKVKNFPAPALLRSFRASPESGVVPSSHMLSMISFQCSPDENVSLVNVPAYTCSLLDTSKNQVVVGKFPVCITIAAFYNTFTLFPLGEMNFHIIDVGSACTREVIMTNTSKSPINFNIIVPEKYVEPPEPEKAAKAKEGTKIKIPPIKCGNFLIMNEDNLIAPGASRTIQIQFFATGTRLYQETIHFRVDDTSPSEAEGVPFKLVGMGAKPTLDFWNVHTTFREHIILDSLSEYKHPMTMAHCVFVKDTVTLYFFGVIINTSFKAPLDLYNNGLVTANLTVKLMYQSGTNDKIFSCNKQEFIIEPLEHKTLIIQFSPKELLEYRAILYVRLKLLGDEEQTFKVCIIGSGMIPRIRLLSPEVRPYRLADLTFPVTSLGSTSTQSIVIKNISQLKTTAKVIVIQSPHEIRPIFTISVSTVSGKIVNLEPLEERQQQTKVKILLDNDEISKIDIHFNPLNKGRTDCDIKITIKDNPYEFFTIFCTAEAFIEDVMLIGLEMLSMEIDMEAFRAINTIAGVPSNTGGDKKKSKSAPPDKKKKEQSKEKGKGKKTDSMKLLGDVEPSELNYVLDFGGCELHTMHKRSVIMVNNSEKVYKFTWEILNDNILVTPSIGYISPGEEKDLEVSFFSSQPVIVIKEPLICNLVAISNDTLVLDTKGATWDSRQTLTMFAENRELSLKERIESMVHGPYLKTTEDYLSVLTISIYYSGVTEYTKYTTNLDQEMTLGDTFIFEKKTFNFKVINIGDVPMKISWNFFINDVYPERIDREIEAESEIAEVLSVAEAQGTETKKDCSKATLFSKSESRQSVDTWFEVDLPFKIEPARQCLNPKENKVFKVTFSPQDAFLFKIILKSTIENLDPLDENISCNISARALVPLAHLDLEESDYISSGRRANTGTLALPPHMKCLEFNVLGVGCYKKTINIVNPTSEGYEFFIESIDMSEQELVPVHCKQLDGYIDGGTSQEVTFSFTPCATGIYESQWKILIPAHSLVLYLMVVGHARQPDVEFIPKMLIIDNTLVGASSCREALLRNNERDADISFKYNGNSLMNESGISSLTVSPEKGLVKPLSEEIIKLKYTPLSDGATTFKIFYTISHLKDDLMLSVNALSYSITPGVTYYLFGNEHLLSATDLTHIYLDQTAPEYERRILFKVKNNGSATFRYDWTYSCANVKKYLQVWVEPKSGFIAPGSEQDCTLHFLLRNVPVKAFPVDLEITNGPKYKMLLYADVVKPLYHFSSKYHDFGNCIIGAPDRTYKKVFCFYNDDKAPISLSLITSTTSDMLIDFCQEPEVEPNKRVKIPVYFRPKAPKDYEIRLQFWVNTLCEEIILTKGRGIPLLIDLYEGCERGYYLGPVDVGKKLVRDISVINHSMVAVDTTFLFTHAYPAYTFEDRESHCSSTCLIPGTTGGKTTGAEFRVEPSLIGQYEKQNTQQVKDCSTAIASMKVIPSNIMIQPHTRITLKIQYKPVGIINTPTNVVLVAKVLEIVRPLAVLCGSATGYDLKFNQSSLQFDSVRKLGMKSMSVLLINNGSYPSKFCFQPLKNNDFQISPMTGEVAAKSQCKITIKFTPQEYNPFIQVFVKCSFDNYKPLELVLYAACTGEGSPQPMSLHIECPVRDSRTEYITITNPTEKAWHVKSSISAPFETVREFVIEKMETFDIPISFKPLRMGEHKIIASYSPLGETALFVDLTGVATHPYPAGTINFTVEVKEPKTLELPVRNVTEKPEVYEVKTELEKTIPTNFTGFYEVNFAETLHVWGEATGICFWTFTCFEPCEMVCRVIFRDKSTGEYQYYIVNITVIPSKVINTLTFECRAREQIQQEITIKNPLDSSADYYVQCNLLQMAEQITIVRNSEKRCTLTYSPLVEGEFHDSLVIVNELVGTTTYRVIARCLPAKAKTLEYTTQLGSRIPIRLRVSNSTDVKTNFIASTNHPSIQTEREYSLGPDEKGKFLVWFEPTALGVQECTVSFISTVAGEFVFKIKGVATEPTPQGPYQIKHNGYATIIFKNIFNETRTFRITVDSGEFTVSKPYEQIEPKHEVKIFVSRTVPEDVDQKTRSREPTGCLIVETYLPSEPKVQWSYFLQGVQ